MWLDWDVFEGELERLVLVDLVLALVVCEELSYPLDALTRIFFVDLAEIFDLVPFLLLILDSLELGRRGGTLNCPDELLYELRSRIFFAP